MKRSNWLIVCLIVLQGLSFAGSAGFRAARPVAALGDASLGVAVSVDAPCRTDHRGHEAPEHCDHAQCCCILRSLNELGGDAGFGPTVFIFSAPSLLFAGVPNPIGAGDDPVRPPPGWASTWSSRAPPAFS